MGKIQPYLYFYKVLFEDGEDDEEDMMVFKQNPEEELSDDDDEEFAANFDIDVWDDEITIEMSDDFDDTEYDHSMILKDYNETGDDEENI